MLTTRQIDLSAGSRRPLLPQKRSNKLRRLRAISGLEQVQHALISLSTLSRNRGHWEDWPQIVTAC